MARFFEESSSKYSPAVKKALLFVAIGLLGLVSIIVMTVLYNTEDTSKLPNDYSIVFDAGSSGTRMYVYQWKAGFSAAKGDSLVVNQNLACKNDDNGIDKFKTKEEIIEKFSKCVAQAKQAVPDSRKKRAYIFLAATAGMRLLEAQNKTQSDQIFNYIRDYFKDLGFLYKNSSQVRIISGKEEAINAWISANYYENNFKPGQSRSKVAPTKGVLDLGGASTQIVYVPTEADYNNKDFFSDIKIYGVNYKTYSHSFLCYGQNEIALLYQTYILSKNQYKNNSEAACYPTNSKVSLNTNQIFGSPCANGLIFNHTYNFTADLSQINKSTNFNLNGGSNLVKCESEINVLLPSPKCNYKYCSFDGVYQPPILTSPFLGFSGFFYALNNTESLLREKYNGDLDGFRKATEKICGMNIDELKELNKKNDAGISERFLTTMCFFNTFVLNLNARYGFTSYKDLTIAEKVNGYNLNWALGYMISELNRDDFLPYEEPPSLISHSFFLPFVIVMSFVVVALFASFVYEMHRHKKQLYKDINPESESF